MKSKKVKYTNGLFVVSAILGLLILFFVYIIANANYYYVNRSEKKASADLYYFNENYVDKDPLLTKRPGLEDIIRGPIISQNDPMIGNPNAPVTIVQYSDFMCSFCFEQQKIVQNVFKKYSDKLKIIWKDYPETDKESISWKTSRAARCAQEQGKFWNFHKEIDVSESIVSEKDLENISEKIGLSATKFKNCMSIKEVDKQIESNVLEANALQISGVPYMYINDKEVIGTLSEFELSEIIDYELGQLSKN